MTISRTAPLIKNTEPSRIEDTGLVINRLDLESCDGDAPRINPTALVTITKETRARANRLRPGLGPTAPVHFKHSIEPLFGTSRLSEAARTWQPRGN